MRSLKLFLVLTVLPAQQLPSAAQARQSLETPTGTVAFENGALVEARNRLTGETYTAGQRADRGTGLLRPGDQAVWAETATEQAPNADGPQKRISEARWDSGEVLTTTVEAAREGGDFLVRQSGRGNATRLWGCQWGIAGLSDDAVSLIVPAWSGIRLGKGAPFQEGMFDWPGGWEAQMLVVQGKRGGMWIRAEDADDRFKGVSIRYRSGKFDLGFRTYNEGPLEARTTVESVVWRLGFYQGDWRVPARQFREWMGRMAALTPVSGQQPAWADQIRSVIILRSGRGAKSNDEPRAVLKKLTEWVTPAKTLLYIPDWRRDGYDLNYPDYTAYAGFKELVDFAHSLGYRVMPHTCYYGVNLGNPEYERLKPYHLRDLFAGEPITYFWRFPDPPPRIVMLHPGAKAWRELYVRKCREIVERYGVDTLHLDVTLSMPNVTDRADGLNTVQGNVAFHDDLRTALPEVALGGEGLNEVSCRREAFAQTHGLFAVRHPGDQPDRVADDAGVDCSHPVSAYLLSPFTRWYGYLGYPTPGASALYRGWTRAYESWGVTPTLSSPTLSALEHPDADLRARLEEMRLIDSHDLQPDFDANESPDTKCVWRGRDGTKLVYERDDRGGSHAWFAAATGERSTVYRYLRGRTAFQGEGSLGPWAAFDENGLYGLDPERTYLCEPTPRDYKTPHLLRLPEGVLVRGMRYAADFMLFDLDVPPAAIDLSRRFAEATLGTVIDGKEQPIASRAQFTRTRATCGGVGKDGLFAHPPWDQEHGLIGDVFADWPVRVPEGGKPALELSLGLRDGAENADGVTFTVAIDGTVVLQKDWKRCEWLPCRVELSPYAGREVKLRLSVGKGPEGRGSFAWAVWGEPEIVVEPTPQPLSVEVLAPRRVVGAAGSSAGASATLVRREGDLRRHRVSTRVPGATCLFFRKPQPAALPVDLRATPFSWMATVGGMSLPAGNLPAYLTAAPGEGQSGGVTKAALVTHPPIDGSTALDYLLTLPKDPPAELRFSTALQDGAAGTNGVAFLVAVNGHVAYRKEVTGPDGWHEGCVNLSAHAGETVLLSLIVDAQGSARCDWSRWGEPRIEGR